jgi:hypothetical protein
VVPPTQLSKTIEAELSKYRKPSIGVSELPGHYRTSIGKVISNYRAGAQVIGSLCIPAIACTVCACECVTVCACECEGVPIGSVILFREIVPNNILSPSAHITYVRLQVLGADECYHVLMREAPLEKKSYTSCVLVMTHAHTRAYSCILVVILVAVLVQYS